MPIVFGRVQHPTYQRRLVTNSTAWDDLGPRNIVGTCVHRMTGTLWGTDGFFRGDALHEALTDYGIGGAKDGTDDGTIFMWNDPRSQRAPWANGHADGLEGNGTAFYNHYGISAVNRDLVSIELSGCAAGLDWCGGDETPVTDLQFEALCQLIAYWHDQAHVPWDQFPVNPASGKVTELQHYEFATKDCPYTVVRNLTTAYRNRVREILQVAQTGSSTFDEGDMVQTSADDLYLRDAPSLSGNVLAVMPLGRNGIILQGPTVADGYNWYRIETRHGRGWAAGQYLVPASFNNLIRNPTANVDLTYIFPNRNDSSHISRLTVDGNSRVKVVNDGLNAGEGVRYESRDDLNWTGQKYFGGVLHHLKRVPGTSGTLDYMRIGVFYTDGTVDYSGVVSHTLTDSWNTIVFKTEASNPAKTIRKVALVVTKNAAASAFSFYADNAQIVQL